MQTIEEVVGGNIKAARTLKGMSQGELGEAVAAHLGDTWKRRQAVWTAESGKRAFTAAELVVISYVLGVNVAQLFAPPLGEWDVKVGDSEINFVNVMLSEQGSASTEEEKVVSAMRRLYDRDYAQQVAFRQLNEVMDSRAAALGDLMDAITEVLHTLRSVRPVSEQ